MYDVREKSVMQIMYDLSKGKVTSVELVKAYLKRIAMYDSENLNSVLEINPDALFIAEKCDVMRKEGTAEGVMFGIPVLIKDNIDTCDKMHTTAGSKALMNNHPREDSGVVELLREAGAIILGKTNMTEFANFMTEKMPSGYSSRGGQVINPYFSALTPSGSSSGSAVAVASSFAPCAIGTETNGSIISPCKNNCIVGIKPTVGLVSRKGIIPISHTQDTAGPMAKTVEDAAILLTAIAGMDHDVEEATLAIPGDNIDVNYYDFTKDSVEEMRIGYIQDENLSENEKKSLELAVETLEKAGAEMVPLKSDYKNNSCWNKTIMLHEFKNGINSYLAKSDCDMKNLSDIIEYNKSHSKTCLKHGQVYLEQSEKLEGRLCESEYINALLSNLDNSQNEIDNLLDDNDLDLFIQGNYNAIHAVSGYPCITVPTDLPNKKQGSNILFIGRKWSEGTLITAAHTFEKATKMRKAPEIYSFNLAEKDEVNDIYEIINQWKKADNCSWCDEYPSVDILVENQEKQDLFTYKDEQGKIVGTIAFDDENEVEHEGLNWDRSKKAVTLSRLCVLPEYKGKGLGENILRLILAEAKKRGYESARFWADSDNIAIMNMYKKLGYKTVGDIREYQHNFKGYEIIL